jgi:hypothetical protein
VPTPTASRTPSVSPTSSRTCSLYNSFTARLSKTVTTCVDVSECFFYNLASQTYGGAIDQESSAGGLYIRDCTFWTLTATSRKSFGAVFERQSAPPPMVRAMQLHSLQTPGRRTLLIAISGCAGARTLRARLIQARGPWTSRLSTSILQNANLVLAQLFS